MHTFQQKNKSEKYTFQIFPLFLTIQKALERSTVAWKSVHHRYDHEKTTHRLGTWLKLLDLQKSDLISENHQIRLKLGENSAIINLSFYKL